MVDTGIDGTHEAFSSSQIEFKDLVGTSRVPVDYGAVAHGTLMAGLLLSTSHQSGAAPNASFAMVAALRDNGEGENTGLDSDVADAIGGANLNSMQTSSRCPWEAQTILKPLKAAHLLQRGRPRMLESTSSPLQGTMVSTMTAMLLRPEAWIWLSLWGRQHELVRCGPTPPWGRSLTETARCDKARI